MKTKEEILSEQEIKENYRLRDSHIYRELVILPAMQEYATSQTEAKDKEIEKLKKELEESNSMLKYINTSINSKITNYLNK